MFSEILNLAKFVREIIIDRSKKVGGWKKVYDLYRSLDRVIDSSITASEHCLSMPRDPYFLEHPSARPLEIRWVGITNEDFKKLDKAITGFLIIFSEVKDVLEIYDKELKDKLDKHFRIKNGWLSTFWILYNSGVIEADGRRIKRTSVPLMKQLEESFGSLSETELIQVSFANDIDISTDEKREKLFQFGQQNIEGLKKVKMELANFIKEHCKVDDLL
jgi:hypothetical protein